jgi:hypothetical protein
LRKQNHSKPRLLIQCALYKHKAGARKIPNPKERNIKQEKSSLDMKTETTRETPRQLP